MISRLSSLRTPLLRRFATSLPSSSAPKSPAPSPVSRPGPPKLPYAEQREFERAVAAAASAGPFSAPPGSSTPSAQSTSVNSTDEVHPDARKGPKPDFEGEKNPVTGEIGGPKKDPLLHREWTYGGRATDF